MSVPAVNSPARWLSIIGIGEDGLTGLSQSSRDALAQAEIVFGGPRHLRLAGIDARGKIVIVVSGAPTLRLRGDYLAIVTLGFGEIVPQTFLNLAQWTGGPNGIGGMIRSRIWCSENSHDSVPHVLHHGSSYAKDRSIHLLAVRVELTRQGCGVGVLGDRGISAHIGH